MKKVTIAVDTEAEYEVRADEQKMSITSAQPAIEVSFCFASLEAMMNFSASVTKAVMECAARKGVADG